MRGSYVLLPLLRRFLNQVTFPKQSTMTPYRSHLSETLKSVFFLVLALIAFGVTPAVAGSTEKADFDALSRQGFEHFYSLEYDQAIQDFQKAWEARPDEPKAINHLIEALLLPQLYQYNALHTRLYP